MVAMDVDSSSATAVRKLLLAFAAADGHGAGRATGDGARPRARVSRRRPSRAPGGALASGGRGLDAGTSLDRDVRRRSISLRQGRRERTEDRKSTRLNSSHSQISYAVFCLKKKKKKKKAKQTDKKNKK